MDLVDEIAARGVTAVLDDAEDSEATLDTLVPWLGGERLSARADEPELRVRAAWEARDYFEGLGVFDRLTALAILALPPDHDERDPAVARRLLEDHLRASRDGADTEEELRTIADLLAADLVRGEEADGLLDRGSALSGPEDAGGTDRFELEAQSYCTRRYIDARDAGDGVAAQRWIERAATFGETAQDPGDEDLAAVVSLAEQLDIAERWPEAADAYRRVIASSDLDDASVQHFAIREGELRLMTGDPDGAAVALTEVLPRLEARYLAALRDEDVADAAEALAAGVGCLSVAQGQRGEWSELCRTLDRTRGLRLRLTATLRGRPEGAQLLQLERRLQAAQRGAPESAPPADLLEAYRRLLPKDTAELASPDGMDLARALDPGEAIAFVAHHFTGTAVAVAVATDAGPFVDGFLREDVGTAAWIGAFAPVGDEPGWIDALTDPGAAAAGAGLDRLVDGADEAVGAQLRELLDDHGARRVTVLTGDILTLIPWWASPSLEGVEVLAAGSAADLLRERAEAPRAAPRTALVVANPTLDLPVTELACTRLGTTLRDAGFETLALRGRDATEPGVLGRLSGRTLLHFGGHGRSDVAYSALELQADPPPAGDPFPAWVEEATTWRVPEESEPEDPGLWTHRWADLPGRGRLHERQWLASGRLDRWLEHDSGTLAATYRDGACVRVGELWSGADLLVGDAMRDCRLAVLTACESAATGRGEDSRALGLPSALTFAGVGAVVGALWPVDEALAAVWTQMFYEALAAELEAGVTMVSVPALVQATARDVRQMAREEAAARLLALAGAADDPIARFMLEADAARLDDPPFAATHHWAAFYVTGQPTIRFEEAQ